MSKINCRLVRRKNMHGVPSVAPYINDWNVWDIPEEQWTEAVGRAIMSAYRLGWEHALHAVQEVKRPGLNDWEET